MNCKTCKHWKPPTERDDFREVFREDEADVKYGLCTLIELADSWHPAPNPLPLAATKDGSNYDAVLYTQAEFGCVLHELKEEPT